MAASRAIFLSLSLLCFCLAQPGQASSFKPNCTLPPDGTNYVSGANTRGTVAILWNCLSIIFLCTWSIQHLNVPASRPRTKKFFKKVWWGILDSRKKIKWMIFTVLVPEYLMGKALNERAAALAGTRIPGHLDVEWEEIHVYMANMGYFVLDFEDFLATEVHDEQRLGGSEGDAFRKELPQPPAGVANVDLPFEKLMQNRLKGLVKVSSGTRINALRLRHRYWALNNFQWQHIWQRRLISDDDEIADLPEVSARELERLDRGDSIVKLLALLQITYLVIQLIARKVGNLPSTQLEVAALAFSVSSLITYGLYWNRPQGVQSIHIIKAKRIPDEVEFREIAIRGPHYLWRFHRQETKSKGELDLIPIPNDGSESISNILSQEIMQLIAYNDEVLFLAFGALFGGTIFGGLHCLAWNFHFPSSGEAIAWRVCALVTTVLPSLSVVPLGMWLRLNPWSGPSRLSSASRIAYGTALIGLLLVPYIIARLFLIVEMFRSLFFLPPNAFIDTWSGAFPHWG